jgi:PTS system N-acetylglucosamine-specific IIC component
VGLGVMFGYIWPPIQHGINSFGVLMMESGSIGAFVFGVFNRLLIVTGLHHILNNMAWFVFGNFTDPTTGAWSPATCPATLPAIRRAASS